MHKFIFHSDTLGPVLAGMICICCLLSGCRMQARTEMFPSKEGYLVTIGEDPTDRDTRWAKYLYEHLKKRANDDEIVAFGVSEMDMWRIIIQIDPTLQRGLKDQDCSTDNYPPWKLHYTNIPNILPPNNWYGH